MSLKLIMLGTGHAMVTQCYNTCFAIENNGEYFLVDAGGGNGIMSQLEKETQLTMDAVFEAQDNIAREGISYYTNHTKKEKRMSYEEVH